MAKGIVKRASGQNPRVARTANRNRRKKRRTGKKTLHLLLLLVFLLAVGVALSLKVFFKIEKITVMGTDRYLPDEIAAVSGIVVGEHLLGVDKEQAVLHILEAFPYVETAEVHYRLPPAVEIRLTQSMPAGALPEGDEFLLITRSGKVLERGRILIPPEVPLIKGISADSAQPGDQLGEAAEEKLRMLGALLDAAEHTAFGPITNVDISDRLNMKIVYEARIVLELGSEAELTYKLDFIKEVLQNHIGPKERGILDATGYKKKQIRFREENSPGIELPETPPDASSG